MKSRTAILNWFVGHGIILLLVFWTEAVPVPGEAAAAESSSENPISGPSSTEKLVDFIDSIINTSSEMGNSSSVVAFKNETSVTITERTGKAIDFETKLSTREETSQSPADTSTSSTLANSTESVKDAPSELNAKLATVEEHSIQHVAEDAPPKPTTRKPKLKAPIVRRIDLIEPRYLYIESTKAPANERDRLIQSIFGGECTHEIWNQCNRITYWGGDYLVPDKKNPGEMILKHHKIRCVNDPDVCLKNGWTVARCHMLCMSQCNVEYRMNYENLVLHEGACRFPILLKK